MILQLFFILLVSLLDFPSTNVAVLFTKQFSENKFWIANTQVPEFDAHRVKRSTHQCEEVEVQLLKFKNWTFCIFRESIFTYDFMDDKTDYIEDGHKSGVHVTMPLHKLDYIRITGYEVNHRETSKVDGYLLQDKLLGRIFMNGEVFYIDELIMYLPGLMDSNRSIVFNVSNRTDLSNPYEYKRRRRRDLKDDAAYYEGKEVHIALHLDPAWYILPSRYCRKRAIFGVVHMIHIMNSVYRSTDFFALGRPNNIGFFVKKILLFKNNYKLTMAPFMPSRLLATIILNRFLAWPSVANDKSVDMHMLYTGQESMLGINGVSPLGMPNFLGAGGLCAEVRNGMFMNSLRMDYYSRGGGQQHMLDAATAHEMGHSFGTDHDPPDDAGDDDPNAECRYYLMSPFNDKTINFEKGFQFSSCSLKFILPVLQDKDRRKCFHDPPKNKIPFCGNTVVDEGEECDCGNKYRCMGTKSCCNSYDSTTGPPCTYRVDKSGCKPPQGLCCTKSCQYRDLTHLNLTCGPQCSVGCPCSGTGRSGNTSCSCGLNGQCMGDECHSNECTRIGLKECICSPKYPDIKKGCNTCCALDGHCLNAPVATARVLEKGLVKWDDLQKEGVQSQEIKTAIYKKYCASDKEDKCIWLMFRQFPHGEYCLWKGHVGKCTVHSLCVVDVEYEILHRQQNKNGK